MPRVSEAVLQMAIKLHLEGVRPWTKIARRLGVNPHTLKYHVSNYRRDRDAT